MSDNSLTIINPELNRFQSAIKKVRDFASGEDAVKASDSAELYLPKLPGQRKDPVYGPDDYLTYKEYAQVFPAVGRTEESYTGIAFRKPPMIEAPDEKYTDDFTFGGQSITEFAKEMFDEVLETYRPGVLVDVPETDEAVGEEGFISRKDAESQRPFATLYTAENIMDWDEERIDGQLKTIYVKLYEVERTPDETEDFDFNSVERIRVLDLDEDGYYRHRIYEKQNETTINKIMGTEQENMLSGSYLLMGEVFPQMKGSKMTDIPFFPVSPRGHEWALDYPPMNDLTNLAMSWYRNSGSYENGLLLAGSPTACLKGLDSRFIDDGSVKLGAGAVLLFDSEGGEWGFLQIGSEGLSEIKNAMESKKKEMSVVGARILASDPAGVEAAETAMIHRAGEHSVISNIGNSISMVLTEVLRFMYMWDTGAEIEADKMQFHLNIDFDFTKLDPQMLQALMGAVQTGKMSLETYYYNLERGEMYRPDWTKEKELEAIEEEKQVIDDPFSDIIGSEGEPIAEAVEVAKLSGIQITAANDIIGAVARGELSRDAGINQLKVFLGLTDAQAAQVMGKTKVIKPVVQEPSA